MMNKKYLFNGKEVTVEITQYVEPRNNAILVKEIGDEEALTVLSVNVSEELAPNEIAIKDYSEGEMLGFVPFLIDNGFIKPDYLYGIPSGFVLLPVFELTETCLAAFKKEGMQ